MHVLGCPLVLCSSVNKNFFSDRPTMTWRHNGRPPTTPSGREYMKWKRLRVNWSGRKRMLVTYRIMFIANTVEPLYNNPWGPQAVYKLEKSKFSSIILQHIISIVHAKSFQMATLAYFSTLVIQLLFHIAKWSSV